MQARDIMTSSSARFTTRPAAAASYGDLNLLKAAYHKYQELPEVATFNAAKAGSLSCLLFLHEHGVPWHPLTTEAAANGHLACLTYVVRHGAPWSERVTEWAGSGHLTCLKFCHANGAVWHPRTTSHAAEGHLDCLAYAHENGASWHDQVTLVAARGHLDCLTYAHENGAAWNPYTTAMAASGNMTCLRYAHEHGAPWHSMTVPAAINSGAVDCLKYALERGAPTCPNLVEMCAGVTRLTGDLPRTDEHKRNMETLMYLLDAGHSYRPMPGHASRALFTRMLPDNPVLAAKTAHDIAVVRKGEVVVVAAAREKLCKIRVLQRAWRAYMLVRRRRAATVIQHAYLTYTCRPGDGQAFKRARSSFSVKSEGQRLQLSKQNMSGS